MNLYTGSFRIFVIASGLAAAYSQNVNPRVVRFSDRLPSAPTVNAFKELEHGRSAATATMQAVTEEGVEYSADDGTADGRGLVGDGLMLAVRLTPLSYPAKLTAIRILFVSFQGEPSPVGKTIRLVAFAGSGSEPPLSPRWLVDKQVVVPSIGSYIDFPIDNGPEITAGSFFVGYQAPTPASGVGFGSDTEGPQSDRTFYSEDAGRGWGGPLSYTDGTKANALIRAKIATTLPGSGDYELRTDDGSVEGALIRDGGIWVTRLTPPRYPATLKKIRIYVVQVSGEVSPEGKAANLVVFRDPAGTGNPPSNPKLDLTTGFKMGARSEWMELNVDGPVIESGDIYVGYQAPTPANGVAFSIDMDGQPFQRMFRSRDGGATFSGPVELSGEGSQSVPANLMVRAVIGLVDGKAATHQVLADADSVDLGEGGSAEFRCSVKSPSSNSAYTLSASFDPPVAGLSVSLSQSTARADALVGVVIRSDGPADSTSGQLVITASDGSALARLSVPVYLWREIGAQEIGPDGGMVSAMGFSVEIPKLALPAVSRVRLLTGKPVTGREESLGSSIFRVDGLPADYQGGMRLGIPLLASKGAGMVRAAADESATGVLQFTAPDATGKLFNVQHFQPAILKGSTAVLDLPAGKPNVSRGFSMWMLTGWYNIISAQGNFRIFYPMNYRDAAIWVAEQMEKALPAFASTPLDINVFERVSYSETIKGSLGFTVHPFRVVLDQMSTPSVIGSTNGGQIRLNREKFLDPATRGDFRSAAPHELMHLVQDLYGGSVGVVDSLWGTPDPRRWMDEALAVWFEPTGLFEPNFIPPNMRESLVDFLRPGAMLVPADAAREYGYGGSAFLTYLGGYVDKSIPRKWLETRDPGHTPWSQLLPLIGGDRQLPVHWKAFNQKLFLNQLLSNRAFPDLAVLRPTDAPRTFNLIKDGDYTVKTWNGARDLSVEFFALNLPKAGDAVALPALTDVTALGVKLVDNFDDVDVYVLGRSGTIASRSGQGEIVLDDPAAYKAEAPLVVAVVNNAYDFSPSVSSRRDIHVRLGLAEPQVKIGFNLVGQAVIGATYKFPTRNLNIPNDASYRWDFGNGKTASTRNAQNSWSAAGTYTVTVTAEFAGQTVRDSMKVIVAPDTVVTKADLLFDVYRQYKNPVGTSNQKCNDYSISIFDTQGNLAESGSSVARNGAYDTTLPVGDGYSYTINYKYTTPCPDSGTARGKFDVKKGTINYVKVETPPCQTN